MNEKMKKEIARKTIHITGLAYIPALIFLGKDVMAFAVIIVTLSAILFEFARKKRKTVIDDFLREYEIKRVPGYLYTGVAFTIITPFFSTEACMVSAIAAFAGDGVAGIVKRIKPELAIPAFILPCFPLIFLLNLNPVPAITSIIISSLFDGRKWEDNFTVPLSSALSYWILGIFFG